MRNSAENEHVSIQHLFSWVVRSVLLCVLQGSVLLKIGVGE